MGRLEHLRQELLLGLRRQRFQHADRAGGAAEVVLDLVRLSLREVRAGDPLLALEAVNDLLTHALRMPSVPEIRNVAVSNRKSGRLVMKRSLGVVALLAFPLLVQAQAGSSRKVDGFSNTFVLGQPSGYNAAKKWPLLILLHGSGDRAENMFPMWRTAELTKNVIVCALNSRNPQGWDGEDEKAILALLPQLSKEFSVDPAQIWLGGFSAGGFMTAAVEIQHHKLFAGAIIMGSGDPYARQFKEEYKAAALTDHFYLFVGEK